MKQVQIKRIELHYFKGVKNAAYEFGPKITTVTGPNGCGKSTIMDAFNWCLWGKNAAGRADFLVKTVDEQGNEIPHVDHQVKLELDVNGESQVFTRTLVPEYDRTDNLKGNHTDYTWNNVPLKKSEYDRKVADVIGEEIFKLISSTTAFLNLDWQKQRAMLMSMAGDVDYKTVAKKLDFGEDGIYSELTRQFDGKTFDEYKRELDARLKRVNEAMVTIPARMDEVTRNTPDMPNMEELDRQRAELEEQLRAIEQQEQSDTALFNAANAERNDVAKQISELQFMIQQRVNEEESKVRNSIHESNQVFLKAQAEYKGLTSEVMIDTQQAKNQCTAIENQMNRNTAQREQLQQQIAQLREEWTKENKQVFEAQEYLICPITGSICQDGTACAHYDNNQQGAYEAFTQRKKNNLDSITKRGTTMAQQIQSLMQTIDGQLKEIETIKHDCNARCASRDARLQELESIMMANPKRPLIASVDPATIPGIAELQKKIAELQTKLAQLQEAQPIVRTDNSTAKWNVRKQLEAIATEKAKKDQIASADKRIEELQQELADLGAQKADVEMTKRQMLDLEIARMNEVSERVNSMFTMVRFQMFQRQVNGEEVPACVCLCNGVRYQDANTATRINAGIDIASVLANSYKSFAPVFIDGAESVGNIYVPNLPIQQIRLKFDASEADIQVKKQ